MVQSLSLGTLLGTEQFGGRALSQCVLSGGVAGHTELLGDGPQGKSLLPGLLYGLPAGLLGRRGRPVQRVAALVAFYNATGGPYWNENSHWLSDAPVDSWHGVVVDNSGRVSELRLSNNNLTGSLPSEWDGLTGLTFLRIHGNKLTGQIPPELGNLTNLRGLHISETDLEGPIPPELGNLRYLFRLDLTNNNLTGPIPSELGNLHKLEELWLGANQLTGPIPPELGNLASIDNWRMSDNNLTGNLPPELGRLATLRIFQVSNNNLTGQKLASVLALGRPMRPKSLAHWPVPARL